MSPEERELLNRSVALAEDNNRMLHSIKRRMRWSGVVKAIYWLFIIGSAVWAYYFIRPYTDEIKDAYSGAGEVLNNFKQLGQ